MTQASGSAPPRDQTPEWSGADGSIRVTPPPHFEHLPEGFVEAPSAVPLERDHKCSSGVPPRPTLPAGPALSTGRHIARPGSPEGLRVSRVRDRPLEPDPGHAGVGNARMFSATGPEEFLHPWQTRSRGSTRWAR